MKRLTSLVGTAKQTLTEVSEKNVTFMAAGIAYNAFISLAPLLILLLLVASTTGTGLEDRLIALAGETFPDPIAGVVEDIFRGENGSSSASIVGLVVLIWGTLKVFRGLDTAFSEIYETTDRNSFVDKLVDGLVVFVAIVVAILATVGVTAVFVRFSDAVPHVGVATTLALIGGLVAAFLPMYYRFPDADLGWREILPGVFVAAFGWAAFQSLFRVYLQFSGDGSSGFFGGVVVVITWLYFSAIILLLGAVINAVHGGHTSGKAGGVGRGATAHETHREESMDRAEFAAYLRELREELTGRYEGMQPAHDGSGELRRPLGDVEVIEQTTESEAGRRWEVAFRWQSDDGSETAREG
ncbi:YihY/virulence factor BrkB family protein [Halorubrum sp. AD140]|uniref:YihY/virulence factor BrkB family protein n=1 Tax=Halorubrum sp. AD140 TaxID=3050073 RepID=UPI002ACD1985|nr:YihY/virulence factor BrkB family protein [Halorubrum sp. AD140]MDZ5809780.1 YihY/virulence factor BrkB family protein [Halorubrum sp. AD140]